MIRQGINPRDALVVLAGDGDPTSGGGTEARIPALYFRSDGTVWLKTGAGDTAWSQMEIKYGAIVDHTSDGDAFTDNTSRKIRVQFAGGVAAITWTGSHLTTNLTYDMEMVTAGSPGTYTLSATKANGSVVLRRNSSTGALDVDVTIQD